MMAGTQQLQEIAPAFGKRRGEVGEAPIADLGGDPVAGTMPSTGIIDRDPVRGLETCAKQLGSLAVQAARITVQQPDDLPFGDDDADLVQHRRQSFRRHLALDMLQDDEAHQLGSEMPAQPRR